MTDDARRRKQHKATKAMNQRELFSGKAFTVPDLLLSVVFCLKIALEAWKINNLKHVALIAKTVLKATELEKKVVFQLLFLYFISSSFLRGDVLEIYFLIQNCISFGLKRCFTHGGIAQCLCVCKKSQKAVGAVRGSQSNVN